MAIHTAVSRIQGHAIRSALKGAAVCDATEYCGCVSCNYRIWRIMMGRPLGGARGPTTGRNHSARERGFSIGRIIPGLWSLSSTVLWAVLFTGQCQRAHNLHCPALWLMGSTCVRPAKTQRSSTESEGWARSMASKLRCVFDGSAKRFPAAGTAFAQDSGRLQHHCEGPRQLVRSL